MPPKINWPEAIQPLIKKYKTARHPLDYQNLYQLIVMVVLSAQSTDKLINQVAPGLFAAFPDMPALSRATPELLFPYIGKVRNFGNKSKWLVEIAHIIKKDDQIPRTSDQLTELPGIGRKSANVILREAGEKPEGVIVDLHVMRVAPRLGIASGADPKKIERQLMDILPPDYWDAGMAMSFLGREICRPQPQCEICLMKGVCAYYKKISKGSSRTAKPSPPSPKPALKSKRAPRATKHSPRA
jgi:endonuclease-3